MKDYEKFFKKMEDYRIETRFYENGASFKVEELYQAFKSRLMEELIADCHGKPNMARLIDKPEEEI